MAEVIFKCPDCGAETGRNGKPFNSEQGLQIHRARVHGHTGEYARIHGRLQRVAPPKITRKVRKA